MKHCDRIDRQMTEFLFFNAKTKKRKEKKITCYSWQKNIYNTAALIGINLYSVLFLYLFIQFFE